MDNNLHLINATMFCMRILLYLVINCGCMFCDLSSSPSYYKGCIEGHSLDRCNIKSHLLQPHPLKATATNLRYIVVIFTKSAKLKYKVMKYCRHVA